MRRSNRWVVAWIAASMLTVGACGASGSKGSTTTKPKTTSTARATTTTEPDTSGSTTTDRVDAADKPRAAAANIVPADFPTGWTSTPYSGGTSTTFEKCAPDIHLEKVTVAQAGSPDFARQSGSSQTQANSLTRILSSDDVAHSVIAKIADPAFVACTEKLLKQTGLKASTASGKLSAVEVSGLGDEATGIDGQVAGIDAGTGKQASLGVSIVAIRTGDLVTVVTGAALGPTQPSDGALFQRLAQAVADRQHA